MISLDALCTPSYQFPYIVMNRCLYLIMHTYLGYVVDIYIYTFFFLHIHNTIEIHNNVMWDWYYFIEYSTHLDWMWGIFCRRLSVSHNIVMDLNNVMLVFGLNIGIKKKSLNWIFVQYAKSISLALNQSVRPMYDDHAYDEDPHLHCMEPTQHSWVLDPS
jgi:hypothetical protein